MSSSQHPSFIPDTTQYIFGRLSLDDVKRARLVCGDWREQVDALKLLEKRRLEAECRIPYEVASTLESPDLVRRRLLRIFERGKERDFLDSKLYRTYCASGNIPADFLHLLDTNEKWFRIYFDNRDSFFLAYHLGHACLIGNLPLIKFLVKQKKCITSHFHLLFAVASGDAQSVDYLLAQIDGLPSKRGKESFNYQGMLYKHAYYSGNSEVLISILKRFNQVLSGDEYLYAIQSDSIALVKSMREGSNYFHPETATAIRSVKMLKYLIEDCKWVPENRDGDDGLINGLEELYFVVCRFGDGDTLEYLKSKFSFPRLNHMVLMVSSFLAAVTSGNLASLRHMSQNPRRVIAANFLPDEQESIVKNACMTGNLECLKFLFEELGFRPSEQSLVHAASSGNPAMVSFLIEHCVSLASFRLERRRLQMTPKALVQVFHSQNLELISMYLPVINILSPDQIAALIVNPLGVYCLITQNHLPVTQAMFDDAFGHYVRLCTQSRDEIVSNVDAFDLFHFIRYLADTYHLRPSEELDKRARALSVRSTSVAELLAIFSPIEEAEPKERQSIRAAF